MGTCDACFAYKEQNVITRTLNRCFPRCTICSGKTACIRPCTQDEAEQNAFSSDDDDESLDTIDQDVRRNSLHKPLKRRPRKKRKLNDNHNDGSDTETQSDADTTSSRKLDTTALQQLSLDEKLAMAVHYRPTIIDREDWCRYCGSKYGVEYFTSPWGSRRLCGRHYK
eukprot:21500_1